jgi:hypothetical protein
MRQASKFAIVGLAVLLTGCINSTTVINVKPDGSGTIEQTMTMTAQAAAQLQQMAASFGRGSQKPGNPLFDEQNLRAAASKLGEGVTFVSATPIHTNEAEGGKAVYAFTDITKLRLEQKPAAPGGAGAMGGRLPGGTAPEDVAFRFAKTPAGTSRVTVVFPEVKPRTPPSAAPGGQPGAPKPNDAMQAGMLAMARQVMNGLKLSIVLQPAGRLLKTNSPYVQGQQVTLLEVDMSQVPMDDKMLQAVQSAASFEEMKALLKGVKGVKLNPDREVVVEFAGK